MKVIKFVILAAFLGLFFSCSGDKEEVIPRKLVSRIVFDNGWQYDFDYDSKGRITGRTILNEGNLETEFLAEYITDTIIFTVRGTELGLDKTIKLPLNSDGSVEYIPRIIDGSNYYHSGYEYDNSMLTGVWHAFNWGFSSNKFEWENGNIVKGGSMFYTAYEYYGTTNKANIDLAGFEYAVNYPTTIVKPYDPSEPLAGGQDKIIALDTWTLGWHGRNTHLLKTVYRISGKYEYSYEFDKHGYVSKVIRDEYFTDAEKNSTLTYLIYYK